MLFPVTVIIDVGAKMVELKRSCVKEVEQVHLLAVTHKRDTRTKKPMLSHSLWLRTAIITIVNNSTKL